MFSFDGSYIGDIDKLINAKFYDDKTKKLTKIELNLKQHILLNVIEFKNELPLIIDEIKKVFLICSTHYNVVKIEGVKYLAFKNLNDTSFKNYKKHNLLKRTHYENDVRRIIVFNWLMCIKNLDLNLENRLYVRPFTFTYCINPAKSNNVILLSTNENDFYPILSSKTEIPTSIIREWFNGSIELFYETVKDLINQIDVNQLRSTLTDIIKKYNPQYLNWLNPVFERFLNCNVYSEKIDSEYEEEVIY